MGDLNKYGELSNKEAAYAAMNLLKRAQATVILERFGQKSPIPKNSGDTITFTRMESLPIAKSPVSEGVTPKGQKLRVSKITARLEQFGDLIRLTDRLTKRSRLPILKQSSELCGEQAAETIEDMRFNVLKAGATVFYADGVTSRAAVVKPVQAGDFKKITRFFKRRRCKPLTKIIPASVKPATQPIPPSYFALGHTDLEQDIENLVGFVPVHKYPETTKALPGEIGSFKQYRFILSDLFTPWEGVGGTIATMLANGVEPTSAEKCDVYPLIVIGANAYGIVPLQGSDAVEPAMQPPGKKTESDPLGQRGFVSWVTDQTAVILNHNWVSRYEVSCTANPM